MPLGQEQKHRRRRRRRHMRGKGLNRKEKAQVRAIIDAKDAQTTELKHFDIQLNNSINADFTSAGTLDLCQPIQGDGSSERLGDHVTPVSLFLRFELRPPDNDNRVRIVIWRQTMSSGTVNGALSSILEYSTPAQIDRDIYSPYRVHSEIMGFKVLFDKNYFLQYGTNIQNPIEELYFDLRKQKKQIEYSDGVQTGMYHYFLSFISDNAATPPVIRGYSRFRYTDA